MNVKELLDTIEDAVEEGTNVPLSGGKKIVDAEQIRFELASRFFFRG